MLGEESENEQDLNATLKENIEEVIGLSFCSTPEDKKKEEKIKKSAASKSFVRNIKQSDIRLYGKKNFVEKENGKEEKEEEVRKKRKVRDSPEVQGKEKKIKQKEDSKQ